MPSPPFNFILCFVKNIFGSEDRRKIVVLGIKVGKYFTLAKSNYLSRLNAAVEELKRVTLL